MATDRYDQFQLARPPLLADEHWDGIAIELERTLRALDAEDDGQVLGQMKCLVEAVAKVALAIDGTPENRNDNHEGLIKKAHDLLARQPGEELTQDGSAMSVARQAMVITQRLGPMRNDYGAGHGRAALPPLRDELVDLALDGAFMWTRWALRRLGYFSEGRPATLIRDLIEQQANFYRGDLSERLAAANLAAAPARDQRAIGVAVGQRTANHTVNVRIEGVDPCVGTDNLTNWPADYRIGVAQGLMFSPDGRCTATTQWIPLALQVIAPIENASAEIDIIFEDVIRATPYGIPEAPATERQQAVVVIRRLAESSPLTPPTLERLAGHTSGQSR